MKIAIRAQLCEQQLLNHEMEKRNEREEDADFVWCLVFGWLINLWRQSQAENSSRARRLFIHTDTRTNGQTDKRMAIADFLLPKLFRETKFI